ncbi:MAG: hypothetical protein ABEJ58_07035 [Halodesulfurarchaeum sp.]
MSSPSTLNRLKPHAVPLTIFSIALFVTSIVPPLVLGAVSTRTYAITAAVLILAIGSVLPYALLVAFGTIPLLYTGLASYAAPQPSSDDTYSFSTVAAFRHIVAGVSYVVCAGIVGAIGFGAQMAAPDQSAGLQAAIYASVPDLGGLLIAVAFVALQLWRADTALRTRNRGTILATTILGLLIAVSPHVAFWVFSRAS